VTKKKGWFGQRCERLSEIVTYWSGTTNAFVVALGAIVLWGLTGPIFGYSDTWQLAVNTATTIITFLMVFLIQRAQNKDSVAVHLKLNEIVAAMQGASNRLIDVETLSENDLAVLQRFYSRLAALSKHDVDITKSHSIDEARARHSIKTGKKDVHG